MEPETSSPVAETPLPPQSTYRVSHGWPLLGGCFGGCFLSLVLLGGIVFSIFILFAKLISTGDDRIVNHTAPKLNENDRKVVRLELSGVITGLKANGWTSEISSDVFVREAIEEATEDSEVDALLLVVDSPGGGVTASDALYHALENFKLANPERKVVVMGGDIVASGAYYLAMQADWIRLQPTSIVGSIGVIVPGVNAAGLAAKLGLQDNSIASGASKDINNPLKPINPEHNLILKEVVDGMYERFVSLVAQGRKLPLEAVRPLADGRVFLADKAVALGLVDDIGYEDTLDEKLAELLACDVDDLVIVPHTPETNFFIRLLGDFPAAIGRGMTEPFIRQPRRTPEYRW